MHELLAAALTVRAFSPALPPACRSANLRPDLSCCLPCQVDRFVKSNMADGHLHEA